VLKEREVCAKERAFKRDVHASGKSSIVIAAYRSILSIILYRKPACTQQQPPYYRHFFFSAMGAASKICSVILRFCELASAAIVAGIVGRYLHFLTEANAHAGSRIIYTEVIAGISILFSILLSPPLKYSFYFFVIDFVLLICWMVAFGLLCSVSYSIIPIAKNACCEFY
jgi:hypothetical protein